MTTNERLLMLSAGARASILTIHDSLKPHELKAIAEENDDLLEALKEFDIVLREVLTARGGA